MEQTSIISSITGRIKYSCKFPKCTNRYYAPNSGVKNKRFHRFPSSNQEIQDKWKLVCGIDLHINTKHFYVCEDHFTAADYRSHLRNRLNCQAVPSLDVFSNTTNVLSKDCAVDNFSSSLNEHDYSKGPILNLEEINKNIQEDHSYFVTINVQHLDDHSYTKVQPINVNNVIKSVQDDHDYFHRTNTVQVNNSASNNVDLDVYFSEHDYCTPTSNNYISCDNVINSEVINNPTKTPKKQRGFLKCCGLRSTQLTPRKKKMYRIHRSVKSNLFKTKKKLATEIQKLEHLKTMYEDNRFEFIEKKLNLVTKNFINSQLRNVEKKPSAKRWTEQDKIFALSLYKRSPKLYRYLSVYFQVPSTRTLKTILSNIPLDTGINKPLLDHLKNVCQTMNKLDKCCSLIFDEISLSSGFFYDANKDKAFGYEDLGHLGRTSRHANHALVFMLRGMRKTWKQVVAYYLTSATISVANLKNIITLIINQTLEAGFNVMATVCDQGSTNRAALNELCWENSSRFQFKVKGHDIACIFDVPHLLKALPYSH